MANEFYRLDIVVNTTGDEQAKSKLQALDRFIEHTRRRGEMLNRMQASPAVRLLDRFSGPARQIEQHMQRMQQAARMLDRTKIAPLLTVRDNLTSSILKADQVVKRLDLAQASPVIAAQDRVSAVLARLNAALEAINKGDYRAAVEMKGNIIDEITKAKAALSALNEVKAGPIAELRGQLFGQLTKAAAEMRKLDELAVEPKATLRDFVTWKAREIGGTLRGLTSRAWTVTIQAKDKATDVVKRALGIATSPLALLGAGAGATAAIAYPLKLAGEMEQAQIAMEFFTGSAEKGQKFLERLQAFAAKTPFEFPDVRQAAIGLMPLYKNMYGVDKAMDETIRTIRAFGDAAGFTGAGINGMNLALLGFKQIGTMGKLQMEELRQVTENLLIPMDIVLKELGLTGDALADLGKRGIPAKTAMEAIIRALEKNFKGGMEKMSKSLLGLVSTVKDTARLTVTAFGAGMAGPVRRILLDLVGITDYTGEKYKAFQAKLQDAGRRVGEYFERVYNRVKKFWSELAADPAFQKMDWGDKLIYVLDKALDAVKEWLEGPGGKKVQAIFIKLGEIAATAWIAGIIGMVKGAFSSALHGNILGGIGLLAGAGLLGGGLLLRGGISAGKGLFRTGRWVTEKAGTWTAARRASHLAKLEATNPLAAEIARATYGVSKATAPAAEMAVTTAKVAKAAAPATETAAVAVTQTTKATAPVIEAVSKTSKVLSVFGKVAKIAGKLALPVAVGAEIYDIARAQDKMAATARAAGGLGGGFAGAKLGALVGTAILPGIGTIIGGALGGIGGYVAGRWLGNKVVTATRMPQTTVVGENAGIRQTVVLPNGKVAEISTTAQRLGGKTANVVAQPGAEMNAYLSQNVYEPFRSIVNRAESWGRNMIINFTRGRDSAGMSMGGWLNSQVYLPFRNIVVRAESWGRNMMLNFVAGMQQVKVPPISVPQPTVTTAIATTPVKKHAYGGILTKPHLGLVAEAGPEAIIPLSARMRTRAKDLWQRVGVILGALPMVPDLASRAIISTELGALPVVPELTGRVLVRPGLEVMPRLPEMVGKALYQVAAVVPNLPKIAGQGIARIIPHALGGFFDRPHLGLVAEAGPEVIIPLSSRLRTRALDLWQQAGKYLGVKPYAVGGFAGPVPAMAGAGGGITVVNIYMDGAVQNSIQINGPGDIDQVAYDVARIIAIKIKQSLQNRA